MGDAVECWGVGEKLSDGPAIEKDETSDADFSEAPCGGDPLVVLTVGIRHILLCGYRNLRNWNIRNIWDWQRELGRVFIVSGFVTIRFLLE
jgi:hypothetical protein